MNQNPPNKLKNTREQALSWLYSIRMNTDSSELPELGKDAEVDQAYIRGIMADDWQQQADAIWQAHSSASALDPMTHALLQLGTWELQHWQDVTAKRTLNAIINLSHAYAPTDAYKYVNAVLEKVAIQLNRLSGDGRV